VKKKKPTPPPLPADLVRDAGKGTERINRIDDIDLGVIYLAGREDVAAEQRTLGREGGLAGRGNVRDRSDDELRSFERFREQHTTLRNEPAARLAYLATHVEGWTSNTPEECATASEALRSRLRRARARKKGGR
jgi:hypothetical protein